MATRVTEKSIITAPRALFRKFMGLPVANTANAPSIPESWGANNTAESRWRNAADTDDIRALSVNASDQIELGEQVVVPMRKVITFNLSTAASQGTQAFFIADRAYRIIGITEIHATAESTATTLTGYVEKLTGTTAPGSGNTIQSGTFNLKATANTLQSGSVYASGTNDSDDPRLQLAAGDRLGIVLSAASTELAGVVVEVTLGPSGTGTSIVYALKANGDLADQSFFIANMDCIVTRIDYVHSTLGTNGSAVNVQVVKDTSTNAPGAGTDLLTNNTNAGFNCKGAINTVQNGTLTATAASLRLAPGDRLSVDYAGTLTALAGVVIVVTIQPLVARMQVTFTLNKNANLADQAFFISDGNYEILTISEVHSTLGTNGSAVSLQVTRDTATDAPGAGTDLLSNNTNVGFDLKATINTVQVGTFVDTRFNYLLAGDRLSCDFAGTLTAVAGVTVTVSLARR